MVNALIMMLALGAVCGLLLGFASKAFYVEPNHREEDLLALLPGYNCGGCGYGSCDGMAKALADKTGDIDKCRPMKKEEKEKLKEYIKQML